MEKDVPKQECGVWYDASVEMPEREGVILVQIGDKYFHGSSMDTFRCTFVIPDEVHCWVCHTPNKRASWVMPSHFAMPSRWMFIPE